MKNTFINSVNLQGWLYQHDLKIKTTGANSKNPGTEFITGTIDIATDDAQLNIVPVHFTYVTATTAKGNPNATFTALKNIIDGVHGSIMGNGIDKAVKVKVDTAINLNEFYSDRSGKEELVSAKRNEGGFVHVIQNFDKEENERNIFTCDMIITGARRVEESEDGQTPEHVVIKGAIFDFRKSLLPIEFVVTNDRGMDYFESQTPSSTTPFCTQIKGRQISQTIIKKETKEGAFGEPIVEEKRSSKKEFNVFWASSNPYDWDDESFITAKELEDKMKERQTYLATVKQRQDEYKASQGAAAKTEAPATAGFNF